MTLATGIVFVLRPRGRRDLLTSSNFEKIESDMIFYGLCAIKVCTLYSVLRRV